MKAIGRRMDPHSPSFSKYYSDNKKTIDLRKWASCREQWWMRGDGKPDEEEEVGKVNVCPSIFIMFLEIVPGRRTRQQARPRMRLDQFGWISFFWMENNTLQNNASQNSILTSLSLGLFLLSV
jgi:hypothetical protein